MFHDGYQAPTDKSYTFAASDGGRPVVQDCKLQDKPSGFQFGFWFQLCVSLQGP